MSLIFGVCICGGDIVSEIAVYMKTKTGYDPLLHCLECQKLYDLRCREQKNINKQSAYLYQKKKIVYI